MTEQVSPKIQVLGCTVTNFDVDKGVLYMETPDKQRLELRCAVTPQIMVDGNTTHIKGLIQFNIVPQAVLESEEENVPS